MPYLLVRKGAKGRKGAKMTQGERQNWLINIENCAAVIESCLGLAVVQSVLNRYGAQSIWELNQSNLSEVFSELYAIESDLR